MKTWKNRSPGDVADYDYDFAPILKGDTIASVDSCTGVGIEVDDETHDSGTRAKAWLSGGTPETWATVTFNITTVGGREFQRSARIYTDAE